MTTERIIELIENGDYKEAIRYCSDIELELEEALGFDNNNNNNNNNLLQDDFYALYMITLLLARDFNEAKYLWKRAPHSVKHTSSTVSLNNNHNNNNNNEVVPATMTEGEESREYNKLPAIWEVGKSLWNNEIGTAIKFIDDKIWGDRLENIVMKLRKQVIVDQIYLLYKTSTKLTLHNIVESLTIQENEALDVITQLGWVIERDGHCHPSVTEEKDIRATVANVTTSIDSIVALQRTASWMGFIEEKIPKIDISSKSSLSSSLVKEDK